MIYDRERAANSANEDKTKVALQKYWISTIFWFGVSKNDVSRAWKSALHNSSFRL